MNEKMFVPAGRIVNTHGVQGEVKIEVWLDSPKFMKKFKRLFAGDREFEVISGREHKGFFIAKLKGVDNINAAMPLKGMEVQVLKQEANLPNGSFFIQDIIGAAVVGEDGETIGILKDVLETPASLIYIVQGDEEHLIPAVPEFIKETDADKGIIKVKLIEGM